MNIFLNYKKFGNVWKYRKKINGGAFTKWSITNPALESELHGLRLAERHKIWNSNKKTEFIPKFNSDGTEQSSHQTKYYEKSGSWSQVGSFAEPNESDLNFIYEKHSDNFAANSLKGVTNSPCCIEKKANLDSISDFYNGEGSAIVEKDSVLNPKPITLIYDSTNSITLNISVASGGTVTVNWDGDEIEYNSSQSVTKSISYNTGIVTVSGDIAGLGSAASSNAKIKKATFSDQGSNLLNSLTDISNLFNGAIVLTSDKIDFSEWDMSSVVNMQGTFEGCRALTNFDVSSFDTSSVTSMGSIFKNCVGLQSITLGSSFDTSLVENFSEMFSGCKNLTTLNNLNSLDTSSATNMSNMFRGCSSLSSLDISSFNTSEVTNMASMFDNYKGSSITFGADWSVEKVTNMDFMFRSASNMSQTDLSEWCVKDIASAPIKFAYKASKSFQSRAGLRPKWGQGCVFNGVTVTFDSSASSIEFRVILPADETFTYTWNGTEYNLTIADGITIPAGWYKVITLDMNSVSDYNLKVNGEGWFYVNKDSRTGFDKVTAIVLKVTNTEVTELEGTFAEMSNLSWSNVTTSEWDPKAVTSMTSMFKGCTSLGVLDFRLNLRGLTHVNAMFGNCTVDSILFPGIGGFIPANFVDTSAMMSSITFTNTTTLDLSAFNFNNPLNTGGADGFFSGSSGFTSISMPTFGSQITSTASMFSSCNTLTSIDLSNLPMQNVLSTRLMFHGTDISSYTFGTFDTSSVTDMLGMFKESTPPATLDIDTSSVTSMNQMFSTTHSGGASSLTLGEKFDTSSVTDMNGMFSTSLISSLTLPSSWDTSLVTNMNSMFHNATQLSSFDASGWCVLLPYLRNQAVLLLIAHGILQHQTDQIGENALEP